jgi:pyruvate dehydrogenase E2 component (dihydrolipoamide acetyltransferase)
MAVERVIMPKLGAYTEDVLLSQWLVGEGEEIAPGRAIFELETEKTTAEVESESAGWVHRLVSVGQAVPIGATVALIAQTHEEYETLAAAPGADEAAEDGNPFLAYIDRGGAPGSPPITAASPGARTVGTPVFSPRARALLAQLGFTLDDALDITGSGPGGRVVDRDVAAWAEARVPVTEAAPPAEAAELTVSAAIPLRGRRGTIAARMVESLHAAAQLTSVLEVDVKPLVELRARLNDAGATPRIGVTAIVVKLVADALLDHPRLNARVTETEIQLLREINIAVAIETDDGVVAPVVAHADRLSVEEINGRITELVARSRDRALVPDDLSGGTFTVSNGGIHPVDITTAILNPSQCGLLWIGRIRDRPVVLADGTIAVRPTMQACLTFDHRAVDGGPAAAFLATFQKLVAGLSS